MTNGRITSAAQVREAVALARGRASAAGRKRDDVAGEIDGRKVRRRSKLEAVRDEHESRASAANARAVAAGIRKSASAQRRAEAAADQGGRVRISRIGLEKPMPGFDRHKPAPLPAGSDRTGWAKPALDLDGKANLVMKLWAHGGNGSGNAFASKSRYGIDPAALAGDPAEVIFTNIVGPDGPQPGSQDFESTIVSFGRGLEEFEMAVARKAQGEPTAQVFKHIAIALPAGLSDAGRVSLSRDILAMLEKARLPYVAAIQRPSAQRGAKDARNFHLQLVVSNRPLLKAGHKGWEFGLLKDHESLGPDGLKQWRTYIVNCFNSALVAEGLDPCFTALTRAERGLSSRTTSAAANWAERQAIAAKATALLPRVNASIAELPRAIVHSRQLITLDAAKRLARTAASLKEDLQASLAVAGRKSESVSQVNCAHRLNVAAQAALALGLARLQQLHCMRSNVLGLDAEERARKVRALHAAAAGAAALRLAETRVRLERTAAAKQVLAKLGANRTLRIVAKIDSRQLADGMSRLARHRRDLGDQQVAARLEQSVLKINDAERQAMERRQGAIIELEQLKSRKEQIIRISVDGRLKSVANRTMSLGRNQLGFALNNHRLLTMAGAQKTISESVTAMVTVTTQVLASYAEAAALLADGTPDAPLRRIDLAVCAAIGAASDKLAAARTGSDAHLALKAAAQLKVAGERTVHVSSALLERSAAHKLELDGLNVARSLDTALRAYKREGATILSRMEAGQFILRHHRQQADDLEKQQARQRVSAHAEQVQASEILRLNALHEMAARLHGLRKRIGAASVRANYAQAQLPAVRGTAEAGGHKSSILGDLLKIFRKPISPEPKMEEPAPIAASPPVVEPPTPIAPDPHSPATLLEAVGRLGSPDGRTRTAASEACFNQFFYILVRNPALVDVPASEWDRPELYQQQEDFLAVSPALKLTDQNIDIALRFSRLVDELRKILPKGPPTSTNQALSSEQGAEGRPTISAANEKSPQQQGGSEIERINPTVGTTNGEASQMPEREASSSPYYPPRRPSNGPEIG